jgi:hypothetical protein
MLTRGHKTCRFQWVSERFVPLPLPAGRRPSICNGGQKRTPQIRHVSYRQTLLRLEVV